MFSKKDKTVKQIFGKYISKDKISSILLNTGKDLEEKKIAYILINIKEDNSQLENIKENVEFLEKNGVMVESIESILIKGSIGALPYDDGIDIRQKMEIIINTIKSSELMFNSCIYGIDICKYGNIGSNTRMSYTVIIPKLKEKLIKLFSLKDKEIKHV